MSKTKRISALAAGLCFLAAACWFVTLTLPLSAAPQMVSDAPGVTVDLAGANVLHRSAVTYPVTAMRARIQGIVTVEATLDSTGNVVDAHVVSGPQELRRAALQSVLQWHFAMDNATLTRRVNINFSTPEVPTSAPAMTGGVPGGVSGGVIGSVPGGVAPGAVGSISSVSVSPRSVPATSLAGKTLTGVVISGLSEQARNDLLSRLPVRQGDTLAEDSFDRVNKAVREYDEHMTVGRAFSRNGDVSIMIMAPGSDFRTSMAPATMPPPPPSTDPNAPKRITIGGNVQQAKLIRQARPEYPPLAKQARISGVVQLQALIGADGNVKNLQVISGHPLLIPPSLEAVQQWVYQKTLLNGEPVEVLTQIEVNFTLSDQ